jgi:hypothetical protein
LKELRSAHSRMFAELQQALVSSVADTQDAEAEIAALREANKEIEDNCSKLGNVLEMLDKVTSVHELLNHCDDNNFRKQRQVRLLSLTSGSNSEVLSWKLRRRKML